MGVPIYCPICGRYHEQTGTAGCPQPTPDDYLLVNPVESKLDEIIRLLKLIVGEEYLGKNNK
jgi:hypothetical protein